MQLRERQQALWAALRQPEGYLCIDDGLIPATSGEAALGGSNAWQLG
ncbi:MAG: hypothetical protein IPO22_24015 [Anaerolineales bacterium]|nr:hypothetical protein [Anaerolineales bacterium]